MKPTLDLDTLRVEHRGRRFNWRTMLNYTGGSLFEVVALERYFGRFAQPVDFQKCLGCGRPLTGGLVENMLGQATFRWGIAHGEGSCRECGYPYRAYHFGDRDTALPFERLDFLLPYHPDDLTRGTQ